MPSAITVLGLESSCDETAAAVLRVAPDGTAEILADEIHSQIDDHAPYGGVVPEIAARAHIERMDWMVLRALDRAGLGFDDLDGVAATAGPGLIGGVIVGLTTAKAIAIANGLPLVAVNHLEGHALSPRIAEPIAFPYLLLLVSGGHSQLLAVEGVGAYRRYGSTIDDALGEAFDKSAKLLGLGHPGGPALEAAARRGDPRRFRLPRPLAGEASCNFSFSGLKTALRRARETAGDGGAAQADLAASFQQAAADIVADRADRAMARFRSDYPDAAEPVFVAAGGVAANETIRAALRELSARSGFAFRAPPQRLCTDNGAMIAYAGALRLLRGETGGLDIAPRARWPLDPSPFDAPNVYGKKGARA